MFKICPKNNLIKKFRLNIYLMNIMEIFINKCKRYELKTI